MAEVARIHLAPERGAERRLVQRAELRASWGIVGDVYAGPGARQVVLYGAESRTALESAAEPGLCYPRFRENLLLEGLDPGTLELGARIRIADVVLEVSEARKRCWPECALPRPACVIRDHVAFCIVVAGGAIDVGDRVELLNP
mgnify:CR=1 FL=1